VKYEYLVQMRESIDFVSANRAEILSFKPCRYAFVVVFVEASQIQQPFPLLVVELANRALIVVVRRILVFFFRSRILEPWKL